MEIVKQRRKRLLAWILTLVLCVGMWHGTVQATEGTDVTPTEVTPTETTPTEGSDESVNPVPTSETGDGTMPVADTELIVNIINYKGENVENISSKLTVGDIQAETSETDSSTFIFTGLTTLGEASLVTEGDFQHQHKFLGWYDGNGKILEKDISTTGITNVRVMFGSSVFIEWSGYGSGMSYGQEEIGTKEVIVTTPSAPTSEGTGEDYQFFEGWKSEMLKEPPYPNGASVAIPYEAFEMNIQFYPSYSSNVEYSGTYALTADKTFQLGDGFWTVAGDGYTYSGGNTFVVTSAGDYVFTAAKQE